ncbi:MAG: DUF4038 domain-containing protein [Acidobacteria bacterium]|nr:DUF4038 domain-containing protein [Acidobacteriota bacterium]
MFVEMLPTWGSHWALGKAAFNPTNARQYSRFLGARYKDKAIIWILGGDRSITNNNQTACGHTYGYNNIWQMYKPSRTA